MNTPRRAMRIPPDLWSAAVSKAALEGTTVTAVTIEALTEFVQAPACADPEAGVHPADRFVNTPAERH